MDIPEVPETKEQQKLIRKRLNKSMRINAQAQTVLITPGVRNLKKP